MDIHPIDLSIFIVYLVVMLGVGVYFMRRNRDPEDYYVGGRGMRATHIGLSVVATDVGGGFSIGLGGLGFMMGLAGSWMLFTGLLGAWISAVLLIPKVYPTAHKHRFLTFPQFLQFHFNEKVALMAGLISFIGYVGFTSSQILAGAKLASATFAALTLKDAVLIMGAIAVVYTAIGGIKAVIYTDTIQWLILMGGLILIGIPFAYNAVGGMDAVMASLPENHLSLFEIKPVTFINWFITILPIWFVGMTLYQRIYACNDVKTAKRAWRVAGLFEWPVMAFMGIVLGILARVAFETGTFKGMGYSPQTALDPELGLPLLLSTVLPVGLMGLMMSAYFSAIMSTADSCLMAASGNLVTDILGKTRLAINKNEMKLAPLITLIIGIAAVTLASSMQNVLELMLYSYAFMVSGLLVPVLATLFSKSPSVDGAFWSMLTGGSTTLFLIIMGFNLPLGLDANFFGLAASGLTYISFTLTKRTAKHG